MYLDLQRRVERAINDIDCFSDLYEYTQELEDRITKLEEDLSEAYADIKNLKKELNE